MNPIIDSDLIALVTRVKNDALLLLEALYYYHPELRPQKSFVPFKSTWDESEHPRGQPDNAGQFVAVSVGVSIQILGRQEDKKDRAFGGGYDPVPVKNILSRQEKGRLGEHIVAAWLRAKGALEVQEHKTRPNYAVDLFHKDKDGNCEAIEIKTGTINTKSRRWGLTFSRTDAEKELMEKMTPEEVARYREDKLGKLIERKKEACLELEAYFDVKGLKINTVTVIIDPDKKKADIFYFDGLHKGIGYNSDEARKAYQGTISYDVTDVSAVSPKGSRNSRKSDDNEDDDEDDDEFWFED